MNDIDVHPDTERFSDRLRALTWQDHEAAATSTFVGALFRGELPLDAYVALVEQHYCIYDALEGVGDGMRTHPEAGPFVFEELRRTPALAEDLASLRGPDWGVTVTPSPATIDYCARIRSTAGDWPGGFIAHHYTRYLGDLSGGQRIARVVERAYGLDDAGTAFYRFDAIPDLTQFKDDYRRLLDRLPWDASEQDRVIAELRVAYAHNRAVFADLNDRFCA